MKLVFDTVRETREWLDDPANERFMFDRQTSRLSAIVSRREPLRKAPSTLRALATWHEAVAIGNAFAEAPDPALTVVAVLRSVTFRVTALKVAQTLYSRGSGGRLDLNDAALAFFAAFVTRTDDLSGWLLRASNEGSLSVPASSVAGALALACSHLLCEDVHYHGMPMPVEYDSLIKNIDRSEADFVAAAQAALQFRLERSRPSTDRYAFEYSDEMYRIVPIEILTARQIRILHGGADVRIISPLVENPLTDAFWSAGDVALDDDEMVKQARELAVRLE